MIKPPSSCTTNSATPPTRKPSFSLGIPYCILYAIFLAVIARAFSFWDRVQINGLTIKLDKGTTRQHIILVCRPGRFSFIFATEKIVPKEYPFLEFDFGVNEL